MLNYQRVLKSFQLRLDECIKKKLQTPGVACDPCSMLQFQLKLCPTQSMAGLCLLWPWDFTQGEPWWSRWSDQTWLEHWAPKVHPIWATAVFLPSAVPSLQSAIGVEILHCKWSLLGVPHAGVSSKTISTNLNLIPSRRPGELDHQKHQHQGHQVRLACTKWPLQLVGARNLSAKNAWRNWPPSWGILLDFHGRGVTWLGATGATCHGQK